MENGGSNVSGSSSGSSSHRGRTRFPGIPKKCWCDSGIVEKTSRTEENPCRRYFRCGFAATNRLRNDQHVFKWIDEAFRHEIEMLDYQVGVVEEEVSEMKSGRKAVNAVEFEKEIEQLKLEIVESVEEGLMEAKRSMKRMMALVFCGCVLMVVLGILVKN